MKQKPWLVEFLTAVLILIPLTEFFLYYSTTHSENTHIPGRVLILGLLFGTLCLIGSYGVWKVRPWGYIIVFIFILGVFAADLYQIFFRSQHFGFSEIVNVTTVALILIVVLQKDLSAPYFTPRLRWWERKERAGVDIPVHVVYEGKKEECQLVDLSRTGCFLDTAAKIKAGDRVSVDILFEDVKFEATGRVVRGSLDPKGFGIFFTKIDIANRKRLKTIIEKLKG